MQLSRAQELSTTDLWDALNKKVYKNNIHTINEMQANVWDEIEAILMKHLDWISIYITNLDMYLKGGKSPSDNAHDKLLATDIRSHGFCEHVHTSCTRWVFSGTWNWTWVLRFEAWRYKH